MSLFIYIALGLLIGLFELFRRKVYIFDALFFVNANYLLFYSITPIVLIVIPEWQDQVGLFRYYAVDLERTDLALICLIGYLFLVLGWLSVNSLKAKPFQMRLSKRDAERFALIGLVLGIMAFFAYASAMGGVLNAILYGSAIRYGRIDAELLDVGKGEVFKHFMLSLNLVFLYYISRLFQGESLKGLGRIFFVVSGIVLMLYLLSASSRGAFVGLLLAVFVIWTYKDRNRKQFGQLFLQYRRFFFFLLIPILIVVYGKQFFWALPDLISGGVNQFIAEFLVLQELRLGDGTNIFRDSFLKESSHGLVSLSAVIDHFVDKEGYLWFRDYWLLPLHIIPANLLGLTIELPPTVSAVNTEIIQGYLVASSPPAVLAMAIYNAGFLGVLSLFFYGAVGRVIQEKFIQTENSPARDLLLFYFAYLYGGFIGNADIKVYVYSAFPLVLLIVILSVQKLLGKVHM